MAINITHPFALADKSFKMLEEHLGRELDIG